MSDDIDTNDSDAKTPVKKFPKVRPIGHPDTQRLTKPGTVHVVEKMDGANFRFRSDGDRILFGSRNNVYRNEKDLPNAFSHAVEHVEGNCDADTLREGVTYFGEAMHKHTLEYNWDNTPSVLGFAIYDHGEESFAAWNEVVSEFERLGLTPAPLIETEDSDTIDAEYDIPKSKYRDGLAEGVVFWHENGSRAKLRSEEFKEKHGASNHAEPEDYTGHGTLVNKFCTETRIDKRIDDLLDEGHTLGRELMGEGLPQAVSRDILEEHAHEIVSMNETVNLKDYRSLVAKRCLSRLDERIANNH
jgi:hypothetical protein